MWAKPDHGEADFEFAAGRVRHFDRGKIREAIRDDKVLRESLGEKPENKANLLSRIKARCRGTRKQQILRFAQDAALGEQLFNSLVAFGRAKSLKYIDSSPPLRSGSE
jgi:hypothetical protein